MISLQVDKWDGEEDSQGRQEGGLQRSKEMRERLGVREEVYPLVDDGELVIRHSSSLLYEMAKQVRFNYTGVDRALPGLKGRHTTATQRLWLRPVLIETDILMAALNPSDLLREYALRGLDQEHPSFSN